MNESRRTQGDRRQATIDTRRLAAQTGLETLARQLQTIDQELAILEQQSLALETQSMALREEKRLLLAQVQAMEHYLRTMPERRATEAPGRRASDQAPGQPAEPRRMTMSAHVRCHRCGEWLDRDDGVSITVGPDGASRLWTPDRAAYFARFGRTPVRAYLCAACAAEGSPDVPEA